MMRLLRLLKIIRVALRYGLDEIILSRERLQGVRALSLRLWFWRDLSRPRGERLRMALESLGPIFVKFGQVLSTRRDLLPPDIADELARLQDRVPPFPSHQVVATLEGVYGRSLKEVFREFDETPIASASVAQVHLAVLPDGREAAVKVLRPGIDRVIRHDVSLMHSAASLFQRLWSEAHRLKPHEVIDEIEKHLFDELDLMREAANASQLRRNFQGSPLLRIPEMYWDYCNAQALVMERMRGTQINQVATLRAQGVDIALLARNGVEIFFTQVFRDGFFHADMHPGNILVDEKGGYIALDFGIMGTLTDVDKAYLARNFLAFFRRDYRGVALAHVDAGWVPKETRVDEFEAAIRSVCEPIFDKPLKEISFGRLLLRLFQTSRRFNVEIQPQLVLLQKTLLNIEGLGRELDPDLDLWRTAKPYLERWMSEQIGWRGLVRRLQEEAPQWATIFPQLPRLAHRALADLKAQKTGEVWAQLLMEQRRQTNILLVVTALLSVLMGFVLFKIAG